MSNVSAAGVAVLLMAASFLAGCTTGSEPPAEIASADQVPAPNLAATGGYDVEWIDYGFGTLIVDDPVTMMRYPVSVTGTIHFPKGPSADQGPAHPLLVFMHGRHGTCQVVGAEILGTHACPETPVTTPVDSYQGYNYLASNLATHGYIVVSINANQINDRDIVGDYGMKARAQLTLRTLDEMDSVNETGRGADAVSVTFPSLEGRIDMSRIGLMGHSRGGEGVTKAISYNHERGGKVYELAGVFALAPTDFHRQPANGVPFATLLPYCDGDVSTLHGAWMYDDARYLDPTDAAPKHQFLVMGANHNFYNTIWTNDDGGRFRDDTHCGLVNGQPNNQSGRLVGEDQQRTAFGTIAAFLRYYVGGEQEFGAALRGEQPMPESACPAHETQCPDRIHVSYHPGAGQRIEIARGDEDPPTSATVSGGLSITTCDYLDCPSERTYSRAVQWAVTWGSDGSLALDLAGLDASAMSAVTLRAGVDYQDGVNVEHYVPLSIVLTDAAAESATVQMDDYSRALFNPPGNDDTVAKTTLNTVRVPLSALAGVDPSRLVTLELRFQGSGTVQMADIMFAA